MSNQGFFFLPAYSYSSFFSKVLFTLQTIHNPYPLFITAIPNVTSKKHHYTNGPLMSVSLYTISDFREIVLFFSNRNVVFCREGGGREGVRE